MGPDELLTERLRLRRWRHSDRAPFAAMNADPDVMEFMPSLLDRVDSSAFVDRIERHFEAEGFGLWAVELRGSSAFIGYVGLWPATFVAPFTPAVEVGWRLARNSWGHGYASEAARVSTADGFERLGFDEIVSFTSARNVRSRAVMERIGMSRDDVDDFDHPGVAEGDRLRPHVLYRLAAPTSAMPTSAVPGGNADS